MQIQKNWIQPKDVFKLLQTHLLYPNYSYQAIASDIGCNKRTVQHYIHKWDNNKPIKQLDKNNIIELNKLCKTHQYPIN
jgi:transposase